MYVSQTGELKMLQLGVNCYPHEVDWNKVYNERKKKHSMFVDWFGNDFLNLLVNMNSSNDFV